MPEETKSVTHFVDDCNKCPFRKIPPQRMVLDFCGLDNSINIYPERKIQLKCPLKTQMHKFIAK